MSGLRPTFRARSFQVHWWAGLLLGAGSLVVLNVEGVSFGHDHIGIGHRRDHHHHVFFGAHQHSHPQPDHPSDDRGEPHRPATVSSAISLFHPVAFNTLAAPGVALVAAVTVLALPCGKRPAIRSLPPRAPPSVSIRCPR